MPTIAHLTSCPTVLGLDAAAVCTCPPEQETYCMVPITIDGAHLPDLDDDDAIETAIRGEVPVTAHLKVTLAGGDLPDLLDGLMIEGQAVFLVSQPQAADPPAMAELRPGLAMMDPGLAADSMAIMMEMEAKAMQFRARYGVKDDEAWPDAVLEQALVDHGLPPLAQIPGEPKGLMVDIATVSGEISPAHAWAWKRTNAMHLIGHAMLHGGDRCDGCRDW